MLKSTEIYQELAALEPEFSQLPTERQADALMAMALGWAGLWTDGKSLMAYQPGEIADANIEAERSPIPAFHTFERQSYQFKQLSDTLFLIQHSLGLRTFWVNRPEDPHGVSGTGIIAVGILVDNEHGGGVYLFWRGGPDQATMTRHPTIENLVRVTCHGDPNLIQWVDQL